MSKLKIYGDPISGNCLKVKWTADFIGLDYDWIELDIRKGQTRTDEFLKRNPFGQVPMVVLENGDVLVQSNAIIVSLAERAEVSLLPKDFSVRSRVFQWLFWEQNSHEPYIAGRRFRLAYLDHGEEKIDAEWLPRGNAALALMEKRLAGQGFLAADFITLADISILAYTRVAEEGGFILSGYPNVVDWITRCEDALGIESAKKE